MSFEEASKRRSKELGRRGAELEHKSRSLGFTFGTIAIAVPVVAIMLVFRQFDIPYDEQWLLEHRWVGGTMSLGILGWMKLMRWVAVDRHDPKRKKGNLDD